MQPVARATTSSVESGWSERDSAEQLFPEMGFFFHKATLGLFF